MERIMTVKDKYPYSYDSYLKLVKLVEALQEVKAVPMAKKAAKPKPKAFNATV
jgi:hypothetical protein